GTRETEGGFSITLSTRATIVRGDAEMPGKDTAPTLVTVPTKTTLDFFSISVREVCNGSGASIPNSKAPPPSIAHIKVEKMTFMMTIPIPYCPGSGHDGNTKVKRIDGNGNAASR